MPSKSSPGPTRRHSHAMDDVAASIWMSRNTVKLRVHFGRWSGPEKQLTGNRLCDFKELQSRAVGQNVTFAGVRIKEIQSLKAVGIEIVVNIPGQIIIFDCCFAQTCARRPFTSDLIQAIRF